MYKWAVTLGIALVAACPALARNTAPETAAEARSLFERLIAFRTVAGQGQVAAMADYLKAQFLAAGFAPDDIEMVPAGETQGMIVRLRPAAPSAHRPVVFLAHMDVVDARREEWKSDPWTLTERDGALYGRGAVDNKYGLLTLVHAFVRLKREGFVPDRELVLALTGDEETGMATTEAMAERLKGAAFAINADAGGGYRGQTGASAYAYQAGEKTYATFELTARNPGGHSSRPRPDNAIVELSEVIGRIAPYRYPLRWNAVTLGSFRALAPTLEEKVRAPLARFVEAPSTQGAEAVIAADPAFRTEFATTCVPTMLRAGIVENALPTEATATVNCRIFPGETVEGTKATLVRLAANPKLEIKAINTLGDASPISEMPAEAMRALKAVLDVRLPGATVSPYLEAGGTDGLQFRLAGVPTIGAGPLIASDDSNYAYHGIDERIPVAEFVGGLDHYYLFIKALAGAPGISRR